MAIHTIDSVKRTLAAHAIEAETHKRKTGTARSTDAIIKAATAATNIAHNLARQPDPGYTLDDPSVAALMAKLNAIAESAALIAHVRLRELCYDRDLEVSAWRHKRDKHRALVTFWQAIANG